MIKSMTGFGRGECSDEFRKVTVEIKSVNHRYLDTNIRMPRKLNVFEPIVRAAVQERVCRGKVDVYVNCEDIAEAEVNVKYNRSAAVEYLVHLREMAKELSLEDDIRVGTLSRYPDVFSTEEAPINEEEVQPLIEKAVAAALDQLVEGREREGQELQADLEEKLHQMSGLVDKVEERGPQIESEYRERLDQKVRELLDNVQIDESRLASEIVIFADKICTDEETVRLRAHIHSMLDTFQAEGDVGRKLDFIAQEMNREANTILSKANDLTTSDLAIELKTGIEKIREQIQNIE
ncbi:MAG: YicC family protein [Bacteroidales bacterium]|nr:YicC family protein [Bacteroidales bacterium]